MTNRKLFFSLMTASVLGGAIAIGVNTYLTPQNEVKFQSISDQQDHFKLTNYNNDSDKKAYQVPQGLNFVDAAEKVTPAVVHVKCYYKGNYSQGRSRSPEDIFREFFGERSAPRQEQQQPEEDSWAGMSTGSGVILTDDGYIATNNHVVEKADKIEIVLNDKRLFEAEVIGTDPTTDLALLKIEEKGLPFVPYGNSDDVRVGEWVLAVGNPFNLTSTVTAGIISAKARNINILQRSRENYAIESFLQTDAAVNPGNSGGALVDLKGNLIGINTAIASRTGSYSGYSFAVPSELVKKVLDDLRNYGVVQRAILGVQILGVNAEIAEEYGLKNVEGVYIAGVAEGSGADRAGLEKGDVVLKVGGVRVNESSELQEQIARKRPGETVTLLIRRGSDEMEKEVELRNMQNEVSLAKGRTTIDDLKGELGVTVKALSDDEKEELNLENGVKITSIEKGKLYDSRVQEGFVVTHIDKEPVSSADQFYRKLSKKSGGVLLEGVYPNGEKGFYGLGL
ncbi:Do family serine endopeptidase [Sediminitomix flava]|nr:Do family serine endopeptidase [Sediminitomix flava]